MSFPRAEIETKIEYAFQDERLLQTAFTHSTYSNAHGGKDNERLEYLGDAVLQLIVTEWQIQTSKAQEGALTQNRQKLVCEDALYEAVKGMDIAKYLLISGGKANVGKKTISSLFETIIAAIYLDGGYAPAKAFVHRFLLTDNRAKESNPKGELQEYLQSIGADLPVYESKKEGKDNAPTFVCQVTAQGKSAQGTGSSKRQAEQAAAAALLAQLRFPN